VSVEVTTRLPAPAGAGWARAVTPEGINDELRPVLRMTMPKGLGEASIDTVELGVTLGRSWILLGGLIPVDYDDLRLTELEVPGTEVPGTKVPGTSGARYRFQERSRTSTFAVWSHERIVEPAGGGACTLTDRLGWEFKPLMARVPGAGRLATAVVGFLFRHRHRRLRQYWGP
jgi:hypothetical protein